MAGDIGRTIAEVRGVAPPLGAYNHAVVVRPGRLAFIAGQVGVDPQGNAVGRGDFPAQMRQVFQNLERVLESLGAGFENVVQFTTYLTGSQYIDEFVETRTEIFPRIYPKGDYPTNTLLVIDRLVREEFLIEVEATAALP